MIPTTGPKVAYLLGAGASAKALPVVADLPAAMRNQPFWIRTFMDSSLDQEAMKKYATYLYGLAHQSEKHQSLDTYARTLDIQGRDEELAELKLHVAMFFMLEQAIEEKKWHPEIYDPKLITYKREQTIDSRYLNWMGLITDRNRDLNPRISVLSWNYDLQLEHAIARNFAIEQMPMVNRMPGRRIFPDPEGVPFSDPEHPFLVHLNGVAGVAKWPKGRARCLYERLSSSDPKRYIAHLLDMYNNYDKPGNELSLALSKMLNFAWEDSQVSSDAQLLARNVLGDARVLVVIGYSFPDYNLAIDSDLIGHFFNTGNVNHDKYMVIQNRSVTPEAVKARLQLTSIHPVHQVTNLDVFHIPPELHRK